jgi:putative integral membrane protein (TIGR02587 family)
VAAVGSNDMGDTLLAEARDQIRGVTGALLVVGLTFHYTMETWWLGWILPLPHLVAYAIVGLVGILAITRLIGFRESEQNKTTERNPWSEAVLEFTEIILQSFVASYITLLVLGIIEFRFAPTMIMRLGLIEVVPLGFGAALANRLFRGTDEHDTAEEGAFPRNVGVFAIGALFVASTVAPTQEMELISAHMNYPRHALLIALTLVIVYLILYELDFRGQAGRTKSDKWFQVGTTFMVYALGATVSFFLLLGFGHFRGATLALMYQETVVLAFPASLGAAGAEVVI